MTHHHHESRPCCVVDLSAPHVGTFAYLCHLFIPHPPLNDTEIAAVVDNNHYVSNYTNGLVFTLPSIGWVILKILFLVVTMAASRYSISLQQKFIDTPPSYHARPINDQQLTTNAPEEWGLKQWHFTSTKPMQSTTQWRLLWPQIYTDHHPNQHGEKTPYPGHTQLLPWFSDPRPWTMDLSSGVVVQEDDTCMATL